METWQEKQGNGTPVLHPYDSGISIPAQQNTDCLVPFAITLEITTADDRFLTDIRVNLTTFGGQRSHYSYLVDSISLEERVAYGTQALESAAENSHTPNFETLAEYVFMRNGTHEINFYQLEAGSTVYIIGYALMQDYYSPAHPDGNREMLGEIGFELQLESYIDKLASSDSRQEHTVSLID